MAAGAIKNRLMEKYIFIGATVALTVFGQLVIKARATVISPEGNMGKLQYLWAMYTDPAVLSALAAALLASVTWSMALEKAPLSWAYPFMALNFVVVPFIALALFNEPLSAPRLIGLGLIVAGVVINGLYS